MNGGPVPPLPIVVGAAAKRAFLERELDVANPGLVEDVSNGAARMVAIADPGRWKCGRTQGGPAG